MAVSELDQDRVHPPSGQHPTRLPVAVGKTSADPPEVGEIAMLWPRHTPTVESCCHRIHGIRSWGPPPLRNLSPIEARPLTRASSGVPDSVLAGRSRLRRRSSSFCIFFASLAFTANSSAWLGTAKAPIKPSCVSTRRCEMGDDPMGAIPGCDPRLRPLVATPGCDLRMLPSNNQVISPKRPCGRVVPPSCRGTGPFPLVTTRPHRATCTRTRSR